MFIYPVGIFKSDIKGTFTEGPASNSFIDFNTGCCSFSDGDVTGIEIADGYIRLVKWPNDAGKPNAKVLQGSLLKTVFDSL